MPSGASISASAERLLRMIPVSLVAATVSPPEPSRTSRVSNGSRRPLDWYFGTAELGSAGTFSPATVGAPPGVGAPGIGAPDVDVPGVGAAGVCAAGFGAPGAAATDAGAPAGI